MVVRKLGPRVVVTSSGWHDDVKVMSWPSGCQAIAQWSAWHVNPCERWGMFTAFRGEAVSPWVVLYSHLHYAFFKANLFSFQSSEFTSTRYNPPLFLFPFIWGNHLCGDHRSLSCRKRNGRWMSEDSCTGFAWADVWMSASQCRGRAGAGSAALPESHFCHGAWHY